MATALPPFMRGRDTFVFTFTGQTEATDGTYADDATAGASQSVLLKWNEWDWDSTPIVEEMSSSDMATQHDMIIQDRNEFSCEVNMQRAKGANEVTNAKGNPLASLAMTYDLIKVSVSYGGTLGSPFYVWTFIGRRAPFNKAARKARSTQRLRLSQVNLGPGVPNPSYTVNAGG